MQSIPRYCHVKTQKLGTLCSVPTKRKETNQPTATPVTKAPFSVGFQLQTTCDCRPTSFQVDNNIVLIFLPVPLIFPESI